MDGKLRNMTGIYLMRGDKVLLLYRQGSRVVNDRWVPSAGGHFEKDELNDARGCVLRELREELGYTENDIENLTFRYICMRNVGAEVRFNFYFFAELKDSAADPVSDEGKCKWVDLSDVLSYEMPVTAKEMLRHYLAAGRYTRALYGGVYDGRGMVFTEMKTEE